jgi:hypothetical protein
VEKKKLAAGSRRRLEEKEKIRLVFRSGPKVKTFKRFSTFKYL